MKFLIIASMCLAFTLFVAIFYRMGKNVDIRKRRLERISGKAHVVVDEELSLPFVQRFLLPVFQGMIRAFSRLLPRNRESRSTSRIEKKLALAGMRTQPSEYMAGRLVFAVVVLGITFAMVFLIRMDTIIKMLAFLIGLAVAVLGPSVSLSLRIKRRQQAIKNQLPDILDLLSVSVEAGLSFDGALLYIEQYSYGPLVDELTTVRKEIQMGLIRREALKNLAERNNVPELDTFVGALVQSEQIGLPLRNVMNTQASQLRLTRKQAAEEKAMKAPVKMMIPLILFVLPVTLIILMGPAILNITDALG